ncbi:MAG: hypothetical protein RLZZ436_3787 [Planctomycetota bacterium]|jgi:uncharacterized protein YbcC (UPF0753/DUF2309 family)
MPDIDEEVEREVRELAALLPQQGPITSFAFLNPLQGMEQSSFFEVLRQVPEIYGCEPWLSETRYRNKLQRGRIRESDLREILHEECGSAAQDSIAGLAPLLELRLTRLRDLITPETSHELHWMIAELDSLRRFHPAVSATSRAALLESAHSWMQHSHASGPAPATDLGWEEATLGWMWAIIQQNRPVNTDAAAPTANAGSIRVRELLLDATGQDPDELVTEVLVAFCAAWLDQGYAQWSLPDQEDGFLSAFCGLFRRPIAGARRWLRELPMALEPLRCGRITPAASILSSLKAFGVADADRRAWLRQTLLSLRGWAGMIWQTESRPDRVFRASPPGTLLQFLAIRLLLDEYATMEVIRSHFGRQMTIQQATAKLLPGYQQSRQRNRAAHEAFVLFQLAQIHGWGPTVLSRLTPEDWLALHREIRGFDGLERRRLFHLAFERRLLHHALNVVHIRASRPQIKPTLPKFQIITCIDAREESFRRHLEEACPEIETFGNAGFFCVPMYYRGAAEASWTALCPVVVTPKNWIVEDVVYALEDSHRNRAAARRIIGRASQGINSGSRSSVSGALVTAVLGPLATIPLLGRILFPRVAARVNRTARRIVAPPAITRLRLERAEGTAAGPHDDGIGFTLSEMVNLGERSLRDIGLVNDFANIVLILGHGSVCLNNPHESAYHCGACSGNPGGANARALAAMLNDRRVRRQLEARGISIPEETWFIGGLHNTATEEITFFDLELLPSSHVAHLRSLRSILSSVLERNAHERCRRFESASLELTPADALQHVQERAEDLAQTRPEYGNCTNAMCFVGRRSRIRGLFLDRRSFLMSYDPALDSADSSILARILAAVIPVCEGINLLYTLSAIDNHGWGSGTKLPHNVTSLLGVMDGAASDLRPGLPWQGVDIHEPVRLLFLIETTPSAMLQIMERNPSIANICRNGWAQLAVLDPQTSAIQRFANGSFQPWQPDSDSLPEAHTSFDWYHGHREHLPFASIIPRSPAESASKAAATGPVCTETVVHGVSQPC